MYYEEPPWAQFCFFLADINYIHINLNCWHMELASWYENRRYVCVCGSVKNLWLCHFRNLRKLFKCALAKFNIGFFESIIYYEMFIYSMWEKKTWIFISFIMYSGLRLCEIASWIPEVVTWIYLTWFSIDRPYQSADKNIRNATKTSYKYGN